jgi:glutamate dehydrogenase
VNRQPAGDEQDKQLLELLREQIARAIEEGERGRRGDGGIDELADDALALLRYLPPGEVAVRVHEPGRGRGRRCVVQALVPDGPFVVDTFRLTLDRLGLRALLVIHPLLPIERQDDGSIAAVGDAADRHRESYLYAEVAGIETPAERERVEHEVRQRMRMLREVISDHGQMVGALEHHIQAVSELAPQLVDGEERVRHTASFLSWLEDGHFVFLGYRHYRLAHESSGWEIQVDADSGLGLMRATEESRFDKPLRGEDIPESVRARLTDDRIIFFDKSRSESRIHRHGRLDSISIKELDSAGNVVAFGRFIGLLTNKALRLRPSSIPILERRCRQVAEALQVDPGSHLHKAAVAAFDSLPVEFLFQFELHDVVGAVERVVAAGEHRHVEVCVAPDRMNRSYFVSVSLPRRMYDESLRERLSCLLRDRYRATHIDDRASFLDDDVALIHFFCSSSREVDYATLALLERDVHACSSRWEDAFESALLQFNPEREAYVLADGYGPALPQSYRVATDPRDAVQDVAAMQKLRLEASRTELRLESGDEETLRMKVYRHERPYLTDLLPTLDHFGLRVIDANATHVVGAPNLNLWILAFNLEPLPVDAPLRDSLEERLIAGLAAVLSGVVEDDLYARLTLSAGLDWRQVDVARAYLAYWEQLGTAPARRFVADVLVRHARATRALLEFFRARFDPDLREDRDRAQQEAVESVRRERAAIPSAAEDRVFAVLSNLISSTLRTSLFQKSRGSEVHEIALKFDSAKVGEMPDPRPHREIFVHSREMAGIHLRGGPVARGGIRWSDRPLDFRAEVLGLMKAQMVKNGVIVPVGSKGGFVLKHSGENPLALREMADLQYARFVGSLLSITDGKRGEVTLPPERVVCHDGDDPYLVVAADKGTAHLPDVANREAEKAGFWLGDAFASGGSNGYDHKAEGITAAGAWVSVRRHFQELDVDIERDPYTVVGIGDMSGDVFGNGMLLARRSQLLGAFDHRHIFLDPDPDPETSWQERKRLFELPRSSWADYDRERISEGGGVFERDAKSIPLSPQVREMLGVEERELSGEELVRALLCMPVDLLWNGGIGTYVKAAAESDIEVGDKANAPVRANSEQLRARVVAEGGNLGFTQLARTAYAGAGGRINTDALDNSGGVDLSDHEVNYKLLLADAVAGGRISFESRNALLRESVSEATAHVLANNASQGRCISMDQIRSWVDPERMALASDYLERAAGLDPELEFLPDRDAVRARANQSGTRRGYTRPEVCVLHGYTKGLVKRELVASEVLDQPLLRSLYRDYFPTPLRDAFRNEIERHPLRREITATCLTNRVIDLAGVTLVPELTQGLGASVSDVVMALHVADLVLDAQRIRDEVETLGIKETLRLRARLRVEEGVRLLAGVLLGLEPRSPASPESIERSRGDLNALRDCLLGCLGEMDLRGLERATSALEDRGLPRATALCIEQLPLLARSWGAVSLARELGASLADVSRLHAEVGELSRICFLLAHLEQTDRSDGWRRITTEALYLEMLQAQRDLTRVAWEADGRLPAERARIEQLAAVAAQIAADDPDLAPLIVLSQQIRRLC